MDPSAPFEKAAEKLGEAADALKPGGALPPPGAPSAVTPELEEPTTPREVNEPKPDQRAPEPRTATGAPASTPEPPRAQQGAYLTTATGVRQRDTDHSLRAGSRGPTLLQDHHLREKVTHFDHERIPERVVHARGAGAHGTFTGYGAADRICHAQVFAEGEQTPVFVRFSTVLGSRGSADTVRDTRGFATKFYTAEGNWDLVANNIPVFFIQDGIKFPDVVHAAKPHPDREIPQAQSAHDTFWDFVSLHTEAQHHTLWNMSDRGIPRSYRMMGGFGVHTFRMINAEGETSLVKFHWKPELGVHSLTWEEAQMLAGHDPDFHRRDLFDAIESGAHPAWELGVQVFPDVPDQMFEGIDLLDPTKLVPEELAPVQPLGRLVLEANTTNFFAETEQIAFHTGHLPPGIDATDDPLLAVRNFSYLDTQLSRLGGPNFNQLPINRPHAPVNDMLRDGMHQHAVHTGVAPYKPNTLDGGCPFHASTDLSDPATRAFVEAAVTVPEGRKVRELPASFDDHYSQARMFYTSMSVPERAHIVAAYAFELGKCYEQTVKERQLLALARIDAGLCSAVAAALGLPAPELDADAEGAATDGSRDPVEPQPSLSQIGGSWPVDGRMVGIVVGPESDEAALTSLVSAISSAGMVPLVIAPHGGTYAGAPVQRTFATARSVEFDAIVLTDAPPPAEDKLALAAPAADAGQVCDPRMTLLVQEAFRHAKPIALATGARALLDEARLPLDAPGVLHGDDLGDLFEGLQALAATHRVWERFHAGVA